MVIEDLIFFTIPEEMRKMNEEEISTYFPYAKEEGLCIRNEEKHTIISVSCKKRPYLIGKNASLDDCLKTTEKKIQKKLPSYKNNGYGSKIVDGKKIPVFGYQYMIQGKKQMAKYGLYSLDKYFLAFAYICGEDYAAFAEQKYDEFLSSVKFK